MNKTTKMLKKGEVQRSWYLVDANNKILGRLAAKVASIIKGKHKPFFTPYVDCGDYVIVINASKISVTGRKLKEKKYLTFSGYPSGQKEASLERMLEDKPIEVIKRAVRRMLPRRPLYAQVLKKLKIYAAEEHPYKNRKDLKRIDI
ncbi:MAG: 50S ribosomal protein L13 [Candidatus Omnitrophica bacterium]|nr:50S ribosomal protein L13 [Candidatus Omnitrophota bacterium]